MILSVRGTTANELTRLQQFFFFDFSYLISHILLFFSMEVGARVEAYEVGGEIRHIQSAYFTFIAPDENGDPRTLPKMKAMNKVSNQIILLCLVRFS